MKKFEKVVPRYRIMLVRESEDTFTEYPKFQNSRDLFECFREELASLDREHFVLITLDSKNRTIGYHTISIGSLSTSIVHPRECLKAALLDNAAAVVLPSLPTKPHPRPRA
jgi:DNA repair protein RadC